MKPLRDIITIISGLGLLICLLIPQPLLCSIFFLIWFNIKMIQLKFPNSKFNKILDK